MAPPLTSRRRGHFVVGATYRPRMTELEVRVLEFARDNRPLHEAREVFGWRPVTYVQTLYRLLDRPDVVEWDPVEVHRLQRLREQRRLARATPGATPGLFGRRFA